MNRSKIEWCDHTWNPITGCLHGCSYCYARTMTKRFSGNVRLNKMAKDDYELRMSEDQKHRLYILNKPMLNETGNPLVYPFEFEPTLHRYRFDLLDDLKMGKNIFVGAMADIFGDWVPDEWIAEIMRACEAYPTHNYLFLTKNPERYIRYGVPTERENMWYGTTITGPADMNRIAALMIDGKTFVSIEPLHKRLSKEDIHLICKLSEWVIIGAETGRSNNKIIPEFEWIKDIVNEADSNAVPVFMKDSLIPIVGEENMRRDFPEQLMKKSLSRKLQNKLYDVCCECREPMKKSEMMTLHARSCRGEQPKQCGFMCRSCFKKFFDSHKLKIPKFRIMEGLTNERKSDNE